jgi:hypothetical protein
LRRALAFALVTTASALAHAQNTTGRVHIEGSPDAVLEAYDLSQEWQPVCAAPCDRRLPYAFAYRIAGPNVQRSKPFTLSAQSDAHLTVDAGSRGLHILGLVLTPMGGGGLAFGFAFLTGALAYSCSDCVGGFADTTMVNWGWGMIAGGVAALVAGIVLITMTRTDVSLSGEPVHYVRVRDLAFGRERPLAPQPSLGAPLFSVSF